MAERFDTTERAREEFFSEAQELVDSVGRSLLSLDEAERGGRTDPEIINDIFRAVHTLKGLAGLFGASLLAALTHELEELLNELRLGRSRMSPEILDVLFRAADVSAKILASERGESLPPSDDVRLLLSSLGALSKHDAEETTFGLADYDLDPGLLGVLTEYEEHRLRTNVKDGTALFRIRADFPLATIDTALDQLKTNLRPLGEIITYLPTGDGRAADEIQLEILVASGARKEVIVETLKNDGVTVEEVPKRRSAQHGASRFPPEAATRAALYRSLLPGAEGGTKISLSEPPPGDGHPRTAYPPSMHPMEDQSLRSVSQTVRVDIRKLDRLMNVVGELTIVQTSVAAMMEKMRARSDLRDLSSELDRLHRSFQRNLALLQDGILEVRMVPLSQAFEKLARIVRQVSREQDKEVNLVVTGAETELDKLIVEELSDPLMHMVRNSIDHGIEEREERIRAGKPRAGTVALNAFQKGNQVIIEIEDDGRGIDPVALLATAMERELLTEAEAATLSTRDIFGLIFLPGFTTRKSATELSGRGVGMDIVKTNVARLGGVIEVSSEVMIGTKFTVTLPVTLAILSALIVEVGGGVMVLPLASVEEVSVFEARDIEALHGRETVTLRGRTLPVCRLAKHYRLDQTITNERIFVIVIGLGERRLGLVVDRVIGQQDVVIKALGASLRNVRGFAGATELGDQRIALVVDPASILEEVLEGVGEKLNMGGQDARAVS